VEVRELLEILISARDLLADGSRWSPLHIAVDENDHWVPVGQINAARFNLQGAVIRAAGYRARDAIRAAENALRNCSLETFARTLITPRPMTHAEALEWLETAVSLLTTQMVSEQPARSSSAVSGLMTKISETDASTRQTTGTDDDD